RARGGTSVGATPQRLRSARWPRFLAATRSSERPTAGGRGYSVALPITFRRRISPRSGNGRSWYSGRRERRNTVQLAQAFTSSALRRQPRRFVQHGRGAAVAAAQSSAPALATPVAPRRAAPRGRCSALPACRPSL